MYTPLHTKHKTNRFTEGDGFLHMLERIRCTTIYVSTEKTIEIVSELIIKKVHRGVLVQKP